MRLMFAAILALSVIPVYAQSISQKSPMSNGDAATPNKAPGRAVPGWLVNVHPLTEDGQGDAVAAFPTDKNQIDLSMHMGIINSNNQYAYSGQGYLRVKEPGRYVFIATVEPIHGLWDSGNGSVQCNCQVSLKIEGNIVFNNRTNVQLNHNNKHNQNGEATMPVTFSGGQDLQPGDLPIAFNIECTGNNSKRSEPLGQNTILKWQKNKITFLVRTPDDDTPRPFRNSELFHFVKSKAR